MIELVADANISTVVFDLGGVLIDWNPEYLYAKLIPDDSERRLFLSTICTPEWNHQMDAGNSVPEAVARLADEHPDQAELINAWWTRWPEMLGTEVPGTRSVAESFRDAGMRLLALTNWAESTWSMGRERFPFLDELFDGIVVSGCERTAKPDREIFDILSGRYRFDPVEAVYIDDLPANVEMAANLGYRAHLFESAAQLETWSADLRSSASSERS